MSPRIDTDQPLVLQIFMKIRVVLIQRTILNLFVCLAHLGTEILLPQNILKHRFSFIELRSSDQVVDPLFDPLISLAIVLILRGDIVTQIVCLKFPHTDEVRLQKADLV